MVRFAQVARCLFLIVACVCCCADSSGEEPLFLAAPARQEDRVEALEQELARMQSEMRMLQSRFQALSEQTTSQTNEANAAWFAEESTQLRLPLSELAPLPSLPSAIDPANPAMQMASRNAVPLGGPSQLEQRVDSIERLLKKQDGAALEKKMDALLPPNWRLSLEIQQDQYWTGQDEANRVAVGSIPSSASALRRARFAFQGDYEQSEYRFEVDFALAGRPSILDMYAQLNDLPVINHLRYGHYFEPFSLERVTRNRFVTFMERSMIDQAFAPARNVGVMAFDNWADDDGTWSIGMFHPNSDNLFADEVSDHGELCGTGRVTWLPYYDEPSNGRYFLHLGMAYSIRKATNREVQFRAQPEARFGAQPVNVPFFVDTGIIEANNLQLLGTEVAWINGPFSIQSEYMYVPVNQRETPGGGPDLQFSGWYVYASYFLTGESRPYRREFPFGGTFDRLRPFENFFLVNTDRGVASGMGAWEVAVRLSHLDLSDENIQGGVLTDLTVGLNWYMTPYLRFTSNWVHAFLESPVNGPSDANFYAFRIQYEF